MESEDVVLQIIDMKDSNEPLFEYIRDLYFIVSREIDINGDDINWSHAVSMSSVFLESSDFQKLMERLEVEELVHKQNYITYGGETKKRYRLSNLGRQRLDNIDNKQSVEKVLQDYIDLPISNLMNQIFEDYFEY